MPYQFLLSKQSFLKNHEMLSEKETRGQTISPELMFMGPKNHQAKAPRHDAPFNGSYLNHTSPRSHPFPGLLSHSEQTNLPKKVQLVKGIQWSDEQNGHLWK